MANRNTHQQCSFCAKASSEVQKLISGIGSGQERPHICDECIRVCNELLTQSDDDDPKATKESAKRDLKPKEIAAYLDEHIVGQARAKKVISVAVYNHYKRIKYGDEGDTRLFKGNLLMAGPTGSGKTAVAQALAKLLDVPFVVTDATCLTQAGYVGEDVESIIKSLWIAAGEDVAKASKGIVVIDEIDKIARREHSSSRDVGGEGVQQALLKMIESGQVTIHPEGSRGRSQKEPTQIDTTHVLFILCGAFVGLEKLIKRRISPGSIGFGSVATATQKDEDYNSLITQVTTEDFINFGMIPEFMGRAPILVPFQHLDEDALYEILWAPKNSLVKQYQKLFELQGVTLTFTPEAMRAIVREAISRKSGARGLRAILEEIMLDIMYDLPDREDVQGCIITESVVLKREAPELIFHRKIA